MCALIWYLPPILQLVGEAWFQFPEVNSFSCLDQVDAGRLSIKRESSLDSPRLISLARRKGVPLLTLLNVNVWLPVFLPWEVFVLLQLVDDTWFHMVSNWSLLRSKASKYYTDIYCEYFRVKHRFKHLVSICQEQQASQSLPRAH